MTNKTQFIIRQNFKLDEKTKDFTEALYLFGRIKKTGGKAKLLIKNFVANGHFYRKRIYAKV